jgi:uncharacterized protein (DUF736 family)
VAAAIAAATLLAGCTGGTEEVGPEPAVSLGGAGAPAPEAATTTAPASPAGSGTRVDDEADDVIPLGTPTVVDTTAEVDVEDQVGDGRTVRVDEVRAGAGPGFVVIHDAGRVVLGWAPVSTGVRTVAVELDTPVRAGQQLVAALFRDDGDGAFEPQDDRLVVEEDDDSPAGEPVAEDFDYVLR